MRDENSFDRTVNTQLGDIYRACVNAQTVDELMGQIQLPLNQWLDIDVMTLALVEAPAVLMASRYPLTPTFIERTQAHAARCLEGKSKAIRRPEDIVIQQVGTVSESDTLDEATNILWTGALEIKGRMLAVATFYRQEANKITPIELAALRQVRSLICDGLIRILETPGLEAITVATNQEKSDVAVVSIKDAKLIAQAFGPNRLREVQDEAIDRITRSHPSAFLIARLGIDRIIVIEHPGRGATLPKWTGRLERICQGMKIGGGIDVEFTIEVGEVDAIPKQVEDENKSNQIKIPTESEVGILAG